MIVMIVLYLASIVASLGLAFFFVGTLLKRSNIYGDSSDLTSNMRNFSVTEVGPTNPMR
ncbi:MAG: hypothetical protein IKG93_04365 [Clostridiales bacterium]|nr:hypothetical protein [Clostridiales bacterium]